MNKNAMMIGAILVVVVLGGGWFFMQSQKSVTGDSSPTPTATSTPAVQEPTSSASTDEGTETVKSFDVEAGSYFYDPKEIRVKKGDTVEITLTAKDMMHNFNIDEFNVKSDIVKAGESVVIEFVADKTGTFEYYCSVAQHRKQGQVGKLIVE